MSEYLPSILNGVTGIGVILVRILVDLRFSLSPELTKPLGILVVILGMCLVLWSAWFLREVFLGEVEPRLEFLVQAGPYRFVRHPVYLGIALALTGITIATRSWLGLIGVLTLFLPSELYRARLEDKALSRKFGEQWEDYAARTGFLLPFLGRE
jgi:protein-S-isoprenylcysteine O-methyltransferase Ste14